jgi:hypothetical protein
MPVNCLNPWDNQTKRIYRIDGQYATLNANNGGGGRLDGVIYERDLAANGKSADSQGGQQSVPGSGNERGCDRM